ncbi:hypothetical protein QDT91_29475 (plasmid) [Mycolicibacterium aubagnense]|uniref:hypothetical protein n=1 Tax=Mycolicibacterium aubagnense TaxID=319707 RepID=UPI00244E3FD9|nr:hypothetical protein [Mycolicibacterium aubagnense]WGI36149.1 hypothetical protein QDT91_29475 [Mycolicibacterium aubagnense]
MSYTLDPLLLRAASAVGTSGDTAVAVLASLLGIDAESAEGEQLRAVLIDSGGVLGARAAADAGPSSCSAAVVLMPAWRGQGIEMDLAAQRDQEWRVALAGSAAVRSGAGAHE